MFYDELKKRCAQKGISMTVLADELGFSSGNIGAWKKGGTPRVKLLTAIAERLECTPDELLGIEKKPPAKATVTDDDIKVALFGGDGEVTDEMWEEVKSFAEYVKHKKINDN